MTLNEGDQVITSYRDHGHMLATGMEARGVMAELTGARADTRAARAAHAHVLAEKGFYGGHGSWARRSRSASGWPSRTGTGRTDTIAHAYFGEGASNQGQVYESFNLAALLKLPCIS
jgi:pyruvate dehydrogenase E1 component alpha subunit